MGKIILKHSKRNAYAKGFTLIEVIVVIAVVGLTLPLLFSILYTVLRQQVKIYRLAEVKRQGDYVLDVATNLIRNSADGIYSSYTLTDLTSQCATANSSYAPASAQQFYFKDKTNSNVWFTIDSNGSQIASQSGTTSSATAVNYAGVNSTRVWVHNYSLQCARSSQFSPPVVTIQFDVCYNTGTNSVLSCGSSDTRPEDIASLQYETKVVMTNY